MIGVGCTSTKPASKPPAEPAAERAVEESSQQLAVVAPEATLTAEQLDRDVQVVLRTMREAYGPRAVFVTPAAWTSFERELRKTGEQEHTPRTLCDALGSVLTKLVRPELFASLGKAQRCRARRATSGGLPYEGSSSGDNVAAGAPQLFAVQQPNSDVGVIGVRYFKEPGAKDWKGVDAALERVLESPGVIVDLRGSRGSDPRAIWPLVEQLTGHDRLQPLRQVVRADADIVDALREAYRAQHSERTERSAKVWEGLTAGNQKSTRSAASSGPVARVRVLIDRDCEEACELVARTLETYADAKVLGTVSSQGRLAVGEPGLLTLPHSRVEVTIPTAAYLLDKKIAATTGERGAWYQRKGRGRQYSDWLPRQVEVLRDRFALDETLDRWDDAEPKKCASHRAVQSPKELSTAARERLGNYSPLLWKRRAHISASLHLDMERALAFVNACPGLEATAVMSQDDGRIAVILVKADSFSALSRLVQSEAVEQVSIKLPRQPDKPNRR
ncbi:S41 family peptidase [Persicimonas caeni]|uniref:S41 family peptidase n=1 Tax=Persicimonas caeni TaxID=2292766 RepID=UPI00143D28E1|nr:S41 family peptidase [Persicimonas caeni]